MVGLVAKKSGMSQLVLENGDVVGVTWLEAKPNLIVQIKTLIKDGYAAVQLGAGEIKRYTRPQAGHLKKMDAKVLREIRTNDQAVYQPGDKVEVSIFQIGDRVMVTGVSKGKGFAGTIKRHHFKSGPGSHGHDHHRQPGSIGAMGIARVLPGHRMSGHMGAEQITTKNLRVVAVDAEKHRLAIQGAVPGSNKSWVLIRKHA